MKKRNKLWCKRIGDANRGKKRSIETRKKVSENHWSKRDPKAFKEFIKNLKHPSGKEHHLFKGVKKHSSGHNLIYLSPNKYMLEHRYIMEKYLGRKLKRKEVIHHINGNKRDNRIENLILLKNQAEHNNYHERIRNKQGQFI